MLNTTAQVRGDLGCRGTRGDVQGCRRADGGARRTWWLSACEQNTSELSARRSGSVRRPRARAARVSTGRGQSELAHTHTMSTHLISGNKKDTIGCIHRGTDTARRGPDGSACVGDTQRQTKEGGDASVWQQSEQSSPSMASSAQSSSDRQRPPKLDVEEYLTTAISSTPSDLHPFFESFQNLYSRKCAPTPPPSPPDGFLT